MKSKNILLFPESPHSGRALEESLADRGYNIYYARSRYEADEFLKVCLKGILIVGLKIDCYGFTEGQVNRPAGVWILGWVWLAEVWEKHPDLRSRTIISTSEVACQELYKSITEEERQGVTIISNNSKNVAGKILSKVKVLAGR